MDALESVTDAYGVTLSDYLRTRSESALFRASLLSQDFVESGLGPDDIIALHFEALEAAMANLPPRDQARAVGDAHQFLLEVMITYGVRYKEYLELKLRESIRDAEARAEMERQRTREAEQAERDKADLLALIAHELRTPITAAHGNVNLAVRFLDRGQTERIRPLLDAVIEALDRLTRLTSDLVQASRGEVPMLDRAPHDISMLLTQAYSWVQPTAAAKGVALVFKTQGQPCMVNGSADALLSVFGNLLSNAVRYTPGGGEVNISHGHEQGAVWVEIADNGVGMAPEVQAHIFDKFYRGPDARQSDGQGLGLGLSLVQQMVQAHDGWVEVTSVPGEGSRFRVILKAGGEGTDTVTDMGMGKDMSLGDSADE